MSVTGLSTCEVRWSRCEVVISVQRPATSPVALYTGILWLASNWPENGRPGEKSANIQRYLISRTNNDVRIHQKKWSFRDFMVSHPIDNLTSLSLVYFRIEQLFRERHWPERVTVDIHLWKYCDFYICIHLERSFTELVGIELDLIQHKNKHLQRAIKHDISQLNQSQHANTVHAYLNLYQINLQISWKEIHEVIQKRMFCIAYSRHFWRAVNSLLLEQAFYVLSKCITSLWYTLHTVVWHCVSIQYYMDRS